ncbi:MAG: hypothetical protein RLZZ385_951 [Pseudomonadota bacterium]|jgi:diguanylate cyclase (GGDEF)-like protein
MEVSVNHETPHEECPAGDDVCPHWRELARLREELRELAALVRTDELTGLYNFRYFNQAVELEMERTRRSKQPTVLIMMDLDHFKEINDAYGHEVGNHALSYVAQVIRKAIRRLDIPCRYGGEEFALILPDTDLAAGIMFAGRLRMMLESSRINIDDITIKMTASFGVDAFYPDDERTPREFIDRVDAYLYEAKMKGRNHVAHPPIEEL